MQEGGPFAGRDQRAVLIECLVQKGHDPRVGARPAFAAQPDGCSDAQGISVKTGRGAIHVGHSQIGDEGSLAKVRLASGFLLQSVWISINILTCRAAERVHG